VAGPTDDGGFTVAATFALEDAAVPAGTPA
jgi:hypothetical protein